MISETNIMLVEINGGSYILAFNVRATEHDCIDWFTRANSTKMHVEGTGTLVIKAVTEEDAGDYTCRAVNSIDSEDADASLTVLGRF